MEQIMSSFAEMHNYARKVDDGIEYLENRVRNPHSLNLVTTQSACIAESTLDSIIKHLRSMKEDVESHILEERADAKDSKEICQEVEEFINQVGKDLNDVEASLIPFGFIPFRKEHSDDLSNINSASVGDYLQRTDGNGFLDDSPVFSSPNYNSTPDSASSRRTLGVIQQGYDSEFVTPKLKQRVGHNFKQNINSVGLQRSGKVRVNSDTNYTSLRNYTPPPFYPSSCVKKLSNIITPKENMVFSNYKSRNNY